MNRLGFELQMVKVTENISLKTVRNGGVRQLIDGSPPPSFTD